MDILAGKQKLRMKGNDNCVYKKNPFVIDSFDCAQHCHNVKNPMSIISFSSQLLSESSIHNIGSSAESGNIFTWMQQLGQEKPENLFPVLREIYKEKYNITVNRVGEEVYLYDMHDGKMLYILTQNSLYIRKHHPYLLCRCKRSAAVSDPYHVNKS